MKVSTFDPLSSLDPTDREPKTDILDINGKTIHFNEKTREVILVEGDDTISALCARGRMTVEDVLQKWGISLPSA